MCVCVLAQAMGRSGSLLSKAAVFTCVEMKPCVCACVHVRAQAVGSLGSLLSKAADTAAASVSGGGVGGRSKQQQQELCSSEVGTGK